MCGCVRLGVYVCVCPCARMCCSPLGRRCPCDGDWRACHPKTHARQPIGIPPPSPCASAMDLHIGRSQTTPIDVRRPGLLDRLHLRPATPKYSLQDTLHTLILPANMEWRAPLFPAGPAAGGRGKGVAFATMMMVNAILGAGILSLPYACYKAGLLMSVPFLLLVTCLAYITAMWIVETQSRAQALAHLTVQAYRVTEPESWADDEPDLFPPLPPARPSATRELRAPGQRSASPATRGEILEETRASLESARRAGRSVAHFALPPMPEDFRIADDTRVFELNELCRMFLGRRCQRGYELALFLYVYATLWLYSSIVANTVISIVPVPGLTRFLECDAYGDVFPPECLSSYRLFLAALCALFLPICFVEIAALARVQVLALPLWLFGGLPLRPLSPVPVQCFGFP